jgi:hypothetical protein
MPIRVGKSLCSVIIRQRRFCFHSSHLVGDPQKVGQLCGNDHHIDGETSTIDAGVGGLSGSDTVPQQWRQASLSTPGVSLTAP